MSSYISWWSKFWYCGILDNSGNFFVPCHWSTWFDNCWFSIFLRERKKIIKTNKKGGGILHITYLFVLFVNYHVAHLFEFSVLCYLYCLSLSCVLFTQCCLCFWIVHSRLPLQVLVGSMLVIFLIFCVVFCLSSSRVLYIQCCLCLCIVHYWSYLRFSFTVTMTIVVLFKSCYIQLMSVLFFSLYHALYIDGYLFIL